MPATSVSGESQSYDVFVSYTTDPDYPVSRALEKFLETFHRLKTPDRRPLRRLEVCRDGSDFSAHQAKGRRRGQGVVEELIVSNLEASRHLLVLCSHRTPRSAYVGMEVRWFLEHRGPDDILLAVTEGDDPSGRPEEVFPAAVIEAGLHQRPFFDLRGFRNKRAPTAAKVRDPEEEMTNIAGHLYGDTGGRLMPIWQREILRRARRQRLVPGAIALSLLAVAVGAVYQGQRLQRANVAIERARTAATDTAVRMADVQTRSGRVRDSLSLTQLMRETPGSAGIRNRVVDLLMRRPWTVPIAALHAPAPVVDMDCQAHGPTCVMALEGGHLLRWEAGVASPPAPTTFGECAGKTVHVLFSTDDRSLVASCDKGLRLWTPDGHGAWRVGRELTLEEPIEAIAVNDYANIIVAQDEAGALHLWTPPSGKIRPLSVKSRYKPTWIGAGSDMLAAVSVEGRLTLWDGQGGKERTFKETATVAAMSEHWPQIATVNRGDRVVRLWYVFEGSEHLSKTLPHPGGEVSNVVFSTDGKRLASSTEDGMVWVWDPSSGNMVSSIAQGTAVAGMAFSPDGDRLFTMAEGDAYVWDTASGTLMGELRVGGLSMFDAVSDGKILTVGGRNDELRLWRVQPAREVTLALQHGGPVTKVQFNEAGDRIITVFADRKADEKELDPAAWPKMAVRWNFGAGAALDSYDTLQRRSARPMAISVGGHRAVTVQSGDERGRFADLEGLDGDKPVAIGTVEHASDISAVEFSDDGRRFFTVGPTGAAVWDARTAKAVGPALELPNAAAAALSSDGQWLVAGGLQTVRLWRVGDGAPVASLRETNWVTAVAFNREGTRFVTVSDYHATVRSVPGGQQELRIDHPNTVNSAVFSADGRTLVTTCADGTARLWDAQNGEALREPFRHARAVLSAALSPDGRRLVTGGEDGVTRLWELVELGAGDAPALADLVEATWGFHMTPRGGLTPIDDREDRLASLRRQASTAPDAPFSRFVTWFLDDSGQRTISPHSPVLATQLRAWMMKADQQPLRAALAAAYPGSPLLAAPPPAPPPAKREKRAPRVSSATP
jgi:WD40 repeat protein